MASVTSIGERRRRDGAIAVVALNKKRRSRRAPKLVDPRLRIILVRHGKPAIAPNPRTGHHGFRRYIDAYQDAGLDPQSAPPGELLDLVKDLNAVFTSGFPRANEFPPARFFPKRR